MTKWKSLAGKFTEEELEVIRVFQKFLGFNDNQLVRNSIISLIFVYGTLLKYVQSDAVKTTDKKYQKLRNKVQQYPELREIIPAVEDMVNSWEQGMNKIIKENEPHIMKFTKKRKIGRPKLAKKKRGRPKDLGI